MEEIRDLIDRWLVSPIGQTSVERGEILSARAKLGANSSELTEDEKEAIIACIMDFIDVNSDLAQAIIDYLHNPSTA